MKSIHYLIILASSVFILSSCTKEVAGPTGPTGLTGPQGSSSSYYIAIDSVRSSAWVLNTTTNIYSASIAVPGLTTPNSSIVEVYVANSFNAVSTYWYELPAGSVLSNGDAFQFVYTTYTVNVQYSFTAAPTNETYFKVVVITQP